MSALADIRPVISRNRSGSVRRARRSRIVTAGALALTLGLAAPNGPSVAATRQVPGSAGAGDYYFPAYGNGGYDVRHYDIAVRFDTNTERLRGTTTIAMVPTVSNLERFNLDLVLRATEVRVDGVVAGIRQTSRELVVTPARPLRRGRAATVVVKYAGTPRNATVDGLNPWITTLDGAVALGEPEIAAWWFPSNDHPIDKATFDIDITVPAGKEAISNGRLTGSTTNDGWTRWSWELRSLSTTYLVFAAIGDYRIEQGTSKGLPYLYAFGLLADTPAARDSIRYTAAATRFLETKWGPYPFNRVGGVVPSGGNIGFALETQTRPVYDSRFFSESNRSVVIHEMAHQWFGDSVAVKRWRNIWLNEGFATYSEWLWAESTGEGPRAQERLEQLHDAIPANDPFWDVRIGNPGPASIFDNAVYDRGAMTAQALRHRLGTTTFMRVMRTWVADHADGNVNTAQFIALAERISGEQLDGFFDAWLFTAAKPARTAANGF